MPQAVTHVLIAIIIAELIRDYIIKDKKKFPLHYVLIAGIAGLLPDIDVVVYWVLYFFGFTLQEVHRTFSHTIFLPAIFLVIAIATKNLKLKSKNLGKEIGKIGRRHMTISGIFLMIALGTAIHLILDAIIIGRIMPIYPLSSFSFGLNLVNVLPLPFKEFAIPVIDAILLVLWLIHEELRHKISSFI